jgi:ABC-type sugar transport system ATPase subunit
MDSPALEMLGINKTFSGVQALRDVSFSLGKAEIHALIGENGAGKSTLMNVLMGTYRPDSGEVRLNGAACSIHSPVDAIARGIGMVPQELSLIPEATVAENLFLGNENRNALGFIDWKKTESAASALLKRLGVSLDVTARVSQLSVAYQQLVQVARTLATGANILIFDEPTASLTGKEVDLLFSIMRQLKAEGKSIVFISHRLEELKTITDRITIMRDGQVVHVDETANLSVDKIVEYMVNREIKAHERERRAVGDKVLLSVRNLTRPREYTDVTFDVRKGEIFGIGGLVGSKRTELVNSIFGITRKASGTVTFKGKEIDIRSPGQAIACGIGYVPEERRRDGLFPVLDVGENISITLYRKMRGPFGIKYGQTGAIVEDYIEKLKIKTPSPRVPIRNLSGGNQQKAILSRWIAQDVDLLILDEPTRGIDVNAKYEIYQLIRQLADSGLTVIIVSSEHNELLTLCDRIMVMHEGQVKGFLDASVSTAEDILKMALIK